LTSQRFNNILRYKWQTTLRVVGITLIKTDTNKAPKVDNDYSITQGGSQNLVGLVMMMVITYTNLKNLIVLNYQEILILT